MDWCFAVIVHLGWETHAAKKGMDYCFAVAAVHFEQESPAAGQGTHYCSVSVAAHFE